MVAEYYISCSFVEEEKHHNRGSKVRVSYSKYRMVPEDVIWDDTDDEEDEDLNRVIFKQNF